MLGHRASTASRTAEDGAFMATRVLFLTQWFEPEPSQRGLIPLIVALKARGYEIEVATGFPNYPTGRIMPGYRLRPYQREVMEGIVVHRVFLYPSHSRSSLGRSLNYLSFFVSALVFCLARARRFDLVYVYHPPITTPLAAALSGLVTRRPYLLEVQDLWPDSVAATGMAGTGWMAKILDPVCRFVYRRAGLLFGQSARMTEALVARGVDPVRARTLYNWADEEHARASGTFDVGPLGFEGRFNFVFGGNLGAVQGLDVVVRAAAKAAETVPEIQFTIIGDGLEREALERLVGELGTSHVRIHPTLPRTEIGDVFAAADVLVLHIVDQPLFEITVPSKTQFYMAMGKPVLAAIKGEARDIVVSAAAGIATEPGNVEALAAAMVEMAQMPRDVLDRMGENARRAYLERFSFATAVTTIAAAIDDIANGRPG